MSNRDAIAPLVGGNLHAAGELDRRGFTPKMVARFPKGFREALKRGGYWVEGQDRDLGAYFVYRRTYLLDQSGKRDFIDIYNERGRLVRRIRGYEAVADNNILNREPEYIHSLIPKTRHVPLD